MLYFRFSHFGHVLTIRLIKLARFVQGGGLVPGFQRHLLPAPLPRLLRAVRRIASSAGSRCECYCADCGEELCPPHFAHPGQRLARYVQSIMLVGCWDSFMNGSGLSVYRNVLLRGLPRV